MSSAISRAAARRGPRYQLRGLYLDGVILDEYADTASASTDEAKRASLSHD